VDDGSTDDTKEKLASLIYSGAIRYVYQENRGRSAARNKGISLATGGYLAFLDSDDLFEPDKLIKQVGFFSTHPEAGLVHGGYIKFDTLNSNLGYRNPSWFSGWIYPQMLLQWYTLLATPTVMVPKRVLDEVGGFNEDLYIGEDLDLWRRIARRYPFGYINECLARIRVHAGNTSIDAVKATYEFERYLDRAFEDDRSLSNRFRHRTLSKMYSNQAYILLSGKEREMVSAARTNARLAILHDPLNMNGFIALLSTILGYDSRKRLAEKWRSLRNRLMVHNQNGSSRT
jgi:glycosyltransferase involved in cell wall biosynthesis